MITTGENDLIYFKREEWHMFTLLMLGSGIFWTATYILIIRRSFLDHTYGMPLVALCANISWEGIFSFIYPPFIIQHVSISFGLPWTWLFSYNCFAMVPASLLISQSEPSMEY